MEQQEEGLRPHCVPSCCRPHFMGAETRPSEVSGLPELTRPVVGRDINLDLKDSFRVRVFPTLP